MKRPAVFFDRDNTLIAANDYLADPAKVVLVNGAAEAVAKVRSLGFAVVVFSNQSGVARGLFTEDDVHRVNARLDEVLQDHDPHAVIDRHEFCPFHPDGTVAEYARESDLRKPKPGMILQAAEKLALDLSRSWVIGDAPRDIEAGKAAGCRTIWYKDPHLPPSTAARELMLSVPDAIVAGLKEATDVIARDNLVRLSVSTQAPAPAAPATPVATTWGGPASVPAQVETTNRSAEPQPGGRALNSDENRESSEPEGAADSDESAAPDRRERPATGSESEYEPAAALRRSGGPRSVASAKPLMQVLAQKRSASAAAAASAAASASAQNPRPALVPSSNARLEELSEQILQELQHRHARDEHEFSISKLLAGVVQIIALAVPLISFLLYHSSPQLAIELAIFFQVLTIALLIMGKQR